MSVKWKLYVFLMLNKHNMHRTFAFWSMRLSRKYASIAEKLTRGQAHSMPP